MKKLLFRLLYCTGVTTLIAWFHRKRVTILCYHGVTERNGRSADDRKGLHVNRKRFESHLTFLQRHYHVISLEEYLRARKTGSSLPDRSVVLTFDDGFRNFFTTAAPMLAARKMPATVFLITDITGRENGNKRGKNWTPLDDKRHLSWTEAKQLRHRGFEFGSHTCSHSRLLTLSPVETERELLHSFNDLVTNLGLEQPTLSYPKGEYSSLLAADARKLGYACAVTTDHGANLLNQDRFSLGRTMIGNNDDKASFAVRVSGTRWYLVKIASWLGWRSPRRQVSEKAIEGAQRGLRLSD